MYLVDTSVWVGFLRQHQSKAIDYFNQIIQQEIPFGITSIIYQEILQGASSIDDFKELTVYLNTQRFYYPKDSIMSYESAAMIYMKCRKKGITLRSTIDCLIAQIGIENDLILLHDDKDYTNIKIIAPQLKLYS